MIMFWIGLGIGLVVGSSTGILLYALRTSKEIREDSKENDYGKI
jgi:gas vesicle protein